MRGKATVIYCDGEDGFCGTWDIDYFEQSFSSVGGVRITEKVRAPGFLSDESGDWCPEHQGPTEES